MAFLVEDGTGLTASNSYASEAEYRAHHADRGVDVTAQTTAQVEQALVQSADYVDKRFGPQFRGWRLNNAQAMEWPRADAYDDDGYLLSGVPTELKRAVYEYAWLVTQLARNLAPLPTVGFPFVDPITGVVITQGGGQLRRKTEKVDVIESTVEFSVGSGSGNLLIQPIPQYPQADLWLTGLIKNERTLSRG